MIDPLYAILCTHGGSYIVIKIGKKMFDYKKLRKTKQGMHNTFICH
jgi:hypothetical protein